MSRDNKAGDGDAGLIFAIVIVLIGFAGCVATGMSEEQVLARQIKYVNEQVELEEQRQELKDKCALHPEICERIT